VTIYKIIRQCDLRDNKWIKLPQEYTYTIFFFFFFFKKNQPIFAGTSQEILRSQSSWSVRAKEGQTSTDIC